VTDEAAFTAALPLGPAQRTAYLRAACPDPAQRARVEALLAAHDEANSFLERPVPGRAEVGTNTRTFSPDAPDESADENDPLLLLAPPGRPDSKRRIGHYEVLQVLGRGGFGAVYRAFDEVLHRVVAVKVLLRHIAATSPARKRFLREARTLAQVRHENVVQVYEVGETPLPYLVMEFVPGETLQARLERVGPVEPAEVVRIGRQIAEGLAAAHATGLVHRDIKPGNVLLEGPQLLVKITDFGLARAADDASISRSGLVAGTPMYMAPEQARGDHIDHRADLFSLGSVLYQMLSGRPPFRAANTLAVLKRVCDDDPRPIRELIPEAPAWLCELIERLHAKNPAERIQTAREVADRLAAGPNAPPVAPPVARRGDRRKRLRRAVGALACVAVLALCAWAAVAYYEYYYAPVRFQFSVDDPNAEVSITGDGAEAFRNRWDEGGVRVYTYTELKPGTYKLAVYMGDVGIAFEELTVRGGRVHVPSNSRLRYDANDRWTLSVRAPIYFTNPSKLDIALDGPGRTRYAGTIDGGSQQWSAGRYKWSASRAHDTPVLATGEFVLKQPGVRLLVPSLWELGFADPFPTDGPNRGKAHKLHPGFWHRDKSNALVCAEAENGWLFSPRADYVHFELWAEVELLGECDAALVLCAKYDENAGAKAPRGAPPGYALPFTTRAEGPNVLRVGQRAIVEARVQNGHRVLKVNGRVIEDAKDADGPQSGHIALQQAGAKGTLKVYRFEVRSLPKE
jgi:hypothetical protein